MNIFVRILNESCIPEEATKHSPTRNPYSNKLSERRPWPPKGTAMKFECMVILSCVFSSYVSVLRWMYGLPFPKMLWYVINSFPDNFSIDLSMVLLTDSLRANPTVWVVTVECVLWLLPVCTTRSKFSRKCSFNPMLHVTML